MPDEVRAAAPPRPRIQVPQYNPDDKGANALAWLRSVEYCREASGKNDQNQYHWSDPILIGVAKIALQGKALDWILYESAHNPENFTTWDNFKKHFKERFHMFPTFGEKASIIAELRQQPDETCLDFYDRVGNSMDAIFDSYSPEAPNKEAKKEAKQRTIDEIFGAIFINGLKDHIKPFVVNQNITELAALKQAAARVEANSDKRARSVRKEHLVMQLDEEQINAIQRKGAKKGNSSRFEGVCHYCKKYGHMIKDCFARKKAENQARNGQFRKNASAAAVDSQSTSNDAVAIEEADINSLEVTNALNALLA